MSLLFLLWAPFATAAGTPEWGPSAEAPSLRGPSAPRLPDAPAELWRLPGLADRVHPAQPTLAAFSAHLLSRGFALDGDDDAALAAHAPFEDVLAHTAIHEGVGYVSLNYSARLAPTTVHLDEFLPLLSELNATWDCEQRPLKGTLTTRSFLSLALPPPGHAAFHVLRYLGARLRAPNATLVWGPSLLLLDEDAARRPLWAPSCDVSPAFAARYHSPYFSVVALSPLLSSAKLGLALALSPSNPFNAFSFVKQQWRIDPNITRALQRYPQAPVLTVAGEPWPVTVGGDGVRRLQNLPPAQNPTLTSRCSPSNYNYNPSYCKTTRYVIANFDWNYGGTPNVASESPIGLIDGVPAAQLGCKTC
jgi:hypothetical protein